MTVRCCIVEQDTISLLVSTGSIYVDGAVKQETLVSAKVNKQIHVSWMRSYHRITASDAAFCLA